MFTNWQPFVRGLIASTSFLALLSCREKSPANTETTREPEIPAVSINQGDGSEENPVRLGQELTPPPESIPELAEPDESEEPSVPDLPEPKKPAAETPPPTA